jgi:hypothetical protein
METMEEPLRKYLPLDDQIDKTFVEREERCALDGVEWRICYRRRKQVHSNLEVRVMSCNPVEHKANYIMTWDGSELQGRDAILLKAHRNPLYLWVISLLPARYDDLPRRVQMHQVSPGKKDKCKTHGLLGEFEGVEWVLAEHVVTIRTRRRVKLEIYAQGKAPYKARYALTWNLVEKKFYLTDDLTLLKKFRPELYEAALLKLKGIKFTKGKQS